MVEAYNFISSWQLFPEKGTYEFGDRPKSGIYKIEIGGSGKELSISMNWVSLEDQAFASHYSAIPDGDEQPCDSSLADVLTIEFAGQLSFTTSFIKSGRLVLRVLHEITPKGLLKITQTHFVDQRELTNTEIYHKQFSVLPYSSSVSGAVIKPTEAGVIRHQALSAMEEQTNMQLTQIRQQIELLAIQAKEIQKRKELSMIIYDSKLGFAPVIGQRYFLYEEQNGNHLVSMVGPKEWGRSGMPYKSFVAEVKLLADHTWVEM
jgi:hypothetical protein